MDIDRTVRIILRINYEIHSRWKRITRYLPYRDVKFLKATINENEVVIQIKTNSYSTSNLIFKASDILRFVMDGRMALPDYDEEIAYRELHHMENGFMFKLEEDNLELVDRVVRLEDENEALKNEALKKAVSTV